MLLEITMRREVQAAERIFLTVQKVDLLISPLHRTSVDV